MDGSATCTIAAPGTTSCTAARTPRITRPPAARASVRAAAAMALLCPSAIAQRDRRGPGAGRPRPGDGLQTPGTAVPRQNLTDANLLHADLTGADLTRATLTGEDLTGAKVESVVPGWVHDPETGRLMRSG